MTRTPPHGRRALAAACGLVLALVPAHAAQARIGDLDPSFDVGGIALPATGPTGAAGARMEAVATRADGRPLAAGWADTPGGIAEALVAQFTTGGAPDPGFGTSGVTRVPNGNLVRRLHGVALDGEDRVLAAGDQRATTAPVGSTTPIVLRFSPGGVREPPATFPGTVGGSIGEAHAVAPGPNGTIYVAGWREFVSTVTVDRFFVAQLDANGNLVTSGFGGGDGIAEADFGLDAHAEAMAVGPDGRIVLAGWSTVSAAGPPLHRPALARFETDGTLDETFGAGGLLNPLGATPGAPTGELRGVQVDGVGRITAAGVAGVDALVLRRLAAGTADATFGAGGATLGDLPGDAQLHALALDGTRALVAGTTGPADASQLVLGALDDSGTPEARLGGAPPGWRTFTVGGIGLAGLGVAPGPGGTVYTAGTLGSTTLAGFVSRHLPNAAPIAALASPDQVQAGAPATFDAVGSSDPEGEALSFAFDLDGDGTYEFDGGQNPLALRSFAAPGTYTVGVRVTDPRGAAATAARAIVVTPVAEPPPQPVLGRQGVAAPVRGIVRFRLPGTKNFVRLTELSAIPNGTEIDARKGRVLLTVLHDASGRLDGAEFYAGRFIFNQAKGKTPVTTLRLSGGSFAACRAKAKGARSVLAVAASVTGGAGSKSKKRVRKLWGDGRGKFRTKGRYGAATVRGTKWLTADRCDGTLVRVVRGKVSVEDLVRSNRRPKLVRAGARTLVAAKGGR